MARPELLPAVALLCPGADNASDVFSSISSSGNVRKLSQILVVTDRTDHLHYIRRLCAGGVLRAVGPIVLLDGLCAISLGEQRHSDAEQAKHRSN